MKPYRPSNGTEGMYFMEEHCFQCIHENPDPYKKPKCHIMTLSMAYDLNDPEYPKEWCYVDDKPTCTKWVKWDWNNDGDPDDPENPNVPTPVGPNQLCLPFVLDSIIGTSEIIHDHSLEVHG